MFYVLVDDNWNIYHIYIYILEYTLFIYILVYTTTYASPKTANATTSKSTPLMNTPFLLSLLLCGFEVNCGLNIDCIVDGLVVNRDEDIVDINTDGNILGIVVDENVVVIDTDGNIIGIDTDEDIVVKDTDEDNITKIKNK